MAEQGIEIYSQDLRFKFLPNKQLLTTLNIENPTDKRFGFKVKTTAPKKYVVRPSSGIVPPGKSTVIQVIMQAHKEFSADVERCPDKFMIQSVPLEENEEIAKNSFDKAAKGIKEHRLKVVVEGPPPPPSPVPEAANETDEEPKAGLPSKVAAPAVSRPAEVRPSRSTTSDVVSDRASLLVQNEKLRKERDELRKKVDRFQMQESSKYEEKGSSISSMIPIFHVILAAIIAFIIGMYFAK